MENENEVLQSGEIKEKTSANGILEEKRYKKLFRKANTKGTGFFIAATFFTVLAVLMTVFAFIRSNNFLKRVLENSVENESVNVLSAVLSSFVVVIFWIIVEALYCLPAVVFSALSVKRTKIAIIELVVSSLCVILPFVLLAICASV